MANVDLIVQHMPTTNKSIFYTLRYCDAHDIFTSLFRMFVRSNLLSLCVRSSIICSVHRLMGNLSFIIY